MNLHSSSPQTSWLFNERGISILDECQARPRRDRARRSNAPDLIAPQFREFRNHFPDVADEATTEELERIRTALEILTWNFGNVLKERRSAPHKGHKR